MNTCVCVYTGQGPWVTRLSTACADKADADGGGWREQVGRRWCGTALAGTQHCLLAESWPSIKHPYGGKTGDVEAEDSKMWR